jgi:hypothetical protein
MDDSATCYHEAGHAVIGYLLGGEVKSMALGGEPDDILPARFGDCRIEWSAKNIDLLTQSGREAMTLLAGPVAEIISEGGLVEPSMLGPWQMDFQCAIEAVTQITSDSKQSTILIRQIMSTLDDFLRRQAVWAAVSQLATELDAHEELDAETIADVLSFWLRRIS